MKTQPPTKISNSGALHTTAHDTHGGRKSSVSVYGADAMIAFEAGLRHVTPERIPGPTCVCQLDKVSMIIHALDFWSASFLLPLFSPLPAIRLLT